MSPKLVETTEKVCGFLAFLTNFTALFLIIKKSQKSLGAYKFLMIYIAIFELLYAILNFLSPSQIFTMDSGFLVVMDQNFSDLPVEIAIVLYFATFGTSLANFGVHFIFRYFAIIGNKKFTSPDPFKLLIWTSSPLVLGTAYTISAVHFMGESKSTEQFLRSKVLNISSKVEIDHLAYMGFYIYPRDENGQKYVNWYCIIGIMVVSSLITFSIGIMLYFGIKCYSELLKFTQHSTESQYYRSMEKQLFFSLVLQALIPLVLMHLPSTVIVFLCFSNSAEKIIGVITAIFIAYYPALDPLPNVFIIKNYRKALFELISCSKWIYYPQNMIPSPTNSLVRVPRNAVNMSCTYI